jgi:putative ABC transport system permease protein
MKFVGSLASVASALFRRSRMEGEMDEELGAHIQNRAEDLIRSGISSPEAERRARLEFGGYQKFKEECREALGAHLFETLRQDVRFALRMLRKSPGFAAVAILSLGLGIGANTAIFSVVNAVLLRPLPYAKPGRLVFVPESNPKQGLSGFGMSYPTLMKLQEGNRVFSSITGFATHSLVLTGRGEPAEVRTVVVTLDFFSVLGATPLLGRTFVPEDGQRGAAPVAILSENLWRSRFEADPKIDGSSVTLDKRAYTVIGVMPASFRSPFFNETELVWIPLAQDPEFSVWMTRPPQEHWMPAIARLRPGVTFAQARSELNIVSARLASQVPTENGWQLRIEPLQQTIVGDARSPLLLLLCAVGLVLLIACANIANLLLTRATARAKEIAVRVALGAHKWRIARQLLTESAILGILGGVAGLLLAYWGVSTLTFLLPPGLPQFHSIRVDVPVLVFALILSLAASLIFGLAPVLFAAGSDPQTNLREGARAGEARASERARRFLAVAEIALAMVLLIGAGLLLRSFAHLTSVRPGFETDHVVKAMVSLPQFQYSTPQQWTAFSSQLMTRLQAQPGLQDSACAAPLPIVDAGVSLPFTIVGNPPRAASAATIADYATVSPEYFRVIEIPLVRGRFFNDSDSPSAPAVALISETLAKRYFPNQDPLGRQLIFGFPPHGNVSREIVGVVGDVHDVSLGKKPGPMMYVPFAQAPLWGCEVVVRSSLSSSAVVAAIRTTTQGIDKNLPVTDITTFPDAIRASVAQPRFRTLLLGLFAVIALMLAAVGIFGVISYSVTRRTHEIGIRLALGAYPRNVLRMVIRDAMLLAGAGILIGMAGALAVTRVLGTLLFEVKPTDPPTFATMAAALLLVALAACYIPARRAMRVDPMVALRYE